MFFSELFEKRIKILKLKIALHSLEKYFMNACASFVNSFLPILEGDSGRCVATLWDHKDSGLLFLGENDEGFMFSPSFFPVLV